MSGRGWFAAQNPPELTAADSRGQEARVPLRVLAPGAGTLIRAAQLTFSYFGFLLRGKEIFARRPLTSLVENSTGTNVLEEACGRRFKAEETLLKGGPQMWHLEN